MYLTVPAALEKKINEYRRQRREERGGKVLQVHGAILELLTKALDGVEAKQTVQYADLVRRVEALEKGADRG